MQSTFCFIKNVVFVLLASSILLQAADSAKILVFICQLARSHHIVLHPIIRELAVRGHTVDYYTHVPMPDPPKSLKQIVFPALDEAMQRMEDLNMTEWGRGSVSFATKYMREWKFEDNMTCMGFPEVQQLFASTDSYDLVVGEFFFIQEDFSVLVHKFKALGVAFQSLPDCSWTNEMSGLPDNPAYMAHYGTHYSDKLSFSERLSNFYILWAKRILEYYYMTGLYQNHVDSMMRYDGWESRPPLIDLAKDMALILINSHPSLGYAYPKSPHVREVLGTNVDENPAALPKDLQEFMDSAEHGVIYFSLGSMLSIKELKMIGGYDAFVKTFGKIKQKVLWKWTSWSGEEIPQLPNIKMSKWFPQQSILAHRNTKLFITHGGLGGITEAVFHGVPMVCLPVFADQFKNAKLMSTSGFGVELSFLNLTEESTFWAVSKVLNDPRYKAEATRRSVLFKDRPMKPVDEAVYWIEYVLRHGKVLQPNSIRLPFYQLYLLDILGFLIAVSLLLGFTVKKMLCFAWFLIQSKRTIGESDHFHRDSKRIQREKLKPS